MKSINPEKKLFIHQFLKTIEADIFKTQNYECFYDILTKEKDETFKFKNMLLIAKNNLNSIFKEYEVKEFDAIVMDLIERKKIMERPILQLKKD